MKYTPIPYSELKREYKRAEAIHYGGGHDYPRESLDRFVERCHMEEDIRALRAELEREKQDSDKWFVRAAEQKLKTDSLYAEIKHLKATRRDPIAALLKEAIAIDADAISVSAHLSTNGYAGIMILLPGFCERVMVSGCYTFAEASAMALHDLAGTEMPPF